MSILDNIRNLFGRQELPARKSPQKAAHFGGGGTYNYIYAYSFDGEKNLGEIGPIKDYHLNYPALRMRSWQSLLESEITKTVLDKFTLWIISKGLKLQCNPSKPVLEAEGIEIDGEKFNNSVEYRFATWAKSRYSDHSMQCNLNELAKAAYKTSKVGGDTLVVLRVKNGVVSVQVVDGEHVASPVMGTEYWPKNLQNGNTLQDGIEISPTGEHVAYYVRTSMTKFERIPAKNSQGLRTAFLVYGNKYRIDNRRGIPLIAVCLETLKKLERYKEATVGSAEERQKIAYQIVHNQFSTGENPLLSQMAKAFDADSTDYLPEDIAGRQLANTVAATTNKSTFNMPIGAELRMMESKNELYFKEFYQTNADIICAAVGIPPNVAFSIYNDSFSASRAATKDWEHTITVNREDFSAQFYQPIYELWLHVEILKQKIDAPGYLAAVSSGNVMVAEAYRNARFTGAMFPHIDPEKEVRAERLKLGALADNIPLTNVEQATEALNSGDSDANLEQFADELRRAKEAGIESAPAPQPNPNP